MVWIAFKNGFVPLFQTVIFAVGQKGEKMGCDLYKVSTLNIDVARYMPLETALILVKALMMEYHADTDIEYTIRREERVDALN